MNLLHFGVRGLKSSPVVMDTDLLQSMLRPIGGRSGPLWAADALGLECTRVSQLPGYFRLVHIATTRERWLCCFHYTPQSHFHPLQTLLRTSLESAQHNVIFTFRIF